MKKRLFFLIILAALCVTLLSAAAYADGSQFRLIHDWPSSPADPLTPPYETWYILDNSHIYVTTGERYTYKNQVQETSLAYILDKGDFDDKTIYVAGDNAFATISGSTYGFHVINGGSFTASVTGSQEGNQLVFQCASKGGEGSVSYRYHVYDSTGKLIQYGSTYGSSFRVSVSENGTYEAFVTAVDAGKNVSDCGRASVVFSNYVVDNGVITAYIGAEDEIVIPTQDKEGVPITGIGERAFYDKAFLKKVTVPEGITSIGASAFAASSNIEEINLPAGITSISTNAFTGCYAKFFCPKDSTTAKLLSPRSFFDTNDTDTVFELLYVKTNSEEENPSVLTLYKYHGNKKVIDSFPERVTRIYNNAFKDNEVITSVTIPADVTEIGSSAFSGCTNLAEINADDPQLHTIGTNAFKDCLSLTKLELSDNIQTIGADAFSGCPEGLKIYCGAASDTAKAISRTPYDFYTQVLGNEFRMRWDGSGNVLTLLECTGTRTIVTVPNGVHVIAAGAFDAMKNNLTEVTIPSTVSVIPGSLFDNFKALKTIILSGKDENGAGVQKLEARAIMNCPVLTSVTIPDSVTEIGSYNFVNCPKLTKLVLPDNIKTIGPNSFGNPVKVFCKYDSKTAKNMSAAGLAFYDTNDNDAKYRLFYLEDGKTLALYQYTGTDDTIDYSDFPTYVQYIYTNAFRNNATVTSIILPNAVTGIGADAFYGCTALTKIKLPDDVSNISDNAFRNCNAAVFCAYNSITAKKLSAIGHPFYNASEFDVNTSNFALLYREDGETLALHEYTGTEPDLTGDNAVPDYVKAIDSGAFDAVKATLTKVSIPDAVKVIPTGLFDGFENLLEISFGTGVETVQTNAIRNCPNLSKVTGIPSLNAIKTNFANCPKMELKLESTSLRLALGVPFAQSAKLAGKDGKPLSGLMGESNNPNIASFANDAVTAVKKGETNVLVYSDTLGQFTRIPVEVLSGLKGLTLPSALTTIEAEAFAGDSAAQYVALPDVTDIGNRAFADDTNLMLVNIPSTVTSFGENIFSGSDSVVAVIDNNDTAVSYCQENNIPFQFAANSN